MSLPARLEVAVHAAAHFIESYVQCLRGLVGKLNKMANEEKMLLTLRVRHGPPGWADTDEEYYCHSPPKTQEELDQINKWWQERLARYTYVRDAWTKLEGVGNKESQEPH